MTPLLIVLVVAAVVIVFIARIVFSSLKELDKVKRDIDE